MDATRTLLLAVLCLVILPGCGRKKAGAEAGTPTASATGNSGAASAATPEVFDPLAVRDVGRGYTPQRGPVTTIPTGSVAVECEPAQMNFGVLPPGGKARGTVRLWNVGSAELQISRSITSCGCTASEDLAGRMIRSGGYIDFSVSMTMKSGLGAKKEKITIYFEPGGRRAAVVYFTAEVSLPIRMTPPHLAASDYIDNQWIQTRSGEVTLTALDDRPFTILRAHGLPPDYVDFDPAVDEPRSHYTIRWDLDRFDGVIPWFWVVETDRPDCPIIDARIQHSSTLPPHPQGRPWVSKDQRLLVGIVRKGEPFEATTQIEYSKNSPPDPDSATVVSESTLLSVELIEAQVEDQHIAYRMRLTVTDVAEPGLLYGALAIGANGFTAPLYIVGRVEE